ncbi:hypothetical protein KR222_009314 [Zaprionus bogoriensis]|nr:hypothetical protein KR222_009314 [Zaprionus bogoriensis]
MRSTARETLPLKPPRREKQQQQQQQQQQLPSPPAESKESESKDKEREREQLLPTMYSNLRYARTDLSHSSLLLHQQSSFDGSSAPPSTERTESSETLDVPLAATRETERESPSRGTLALQPLQPSSSRIAAGIESRRYALASALHATAKLAASVDAYTAAATANAGGSNSSDYSQSQSQSHSQSLCDSHRPLRLQQSNFTRGPSSNIGSTRYLNSYNYNYNCNYNNLHSNSPHASSPRFNAQLTSPQQQQQQTAATPTSTLPSPPPPFSLPLSGPGAIACTGTGTGTGTGHTGTGASASIVQSSSRAYPFKLRTYQERQSSRLQPRRAARSSMSNSGEDLHSPTYLSWRKLQLSRAKLKASSKTSALLSGFAMVAMVEVQLDKETLVPSGMLIAFAICTTLLVAVHMLALMISTCILPNVETVCNLHSISLVHESPHERLHWYIETAWAFSTLLGLILFLVEIAILCWVKFYDLSPTAAWSAVVVLIPVMIVFLAFAVHFYRSLVTHKYEVTVSGIRELEMLKEQMEQDHLEIHNNARNNGFNYGASGDIV